MYKYILCFVIFLCRIFKSPKRYLKSLSLVCCFDCRPCINTAQLKADTCCCCGELQICWTCCVSVNTSDLMSSRWDIYTSRQAAYVWLQAVTSTSCLLLLPLCFTHAAVKWIGPREAPEGRLSPGSINHTQRRPQRNITLQKWHGLQNCSFGGSVG